MGVSAGQPIRRSMSIRDLDALFAPFHGQRLWRANLTYADALHLHAGDKEPNQNPKLPGEHGSWILDTRGTDWYVFAADGTRVASSNEEPHIQEQKAQYLVGRAVANHAIDPVSGTLVIGFDDSSLFIIRPNEEAKQCPDVPYWELFTPGHMLLEYGPGHVWNYRRSDIGVTP
jgi:hypothetical protein